MAVIHLAEITGEPAGDVPDAAEALAMALQLGSARAASWLSVTAGVSAALSGELGLTAKSVMHHTTSIYRKLGVRGRAEATAYAFRRGLVPT